MPPDVCLYLYTHLFVDSTEIHMYMYFCANRPIMNMQKNRLEKEGIKIKRYHFKYLF